MRRRLLLLLVRVYGTDALSLTRAADDGDSTPCRRGRDTYVADALRRKLPYGVPGAGGILANLLSYGAEA